MNGTPALRSPRNLIRLKMNLHAKQLFKSVEEDGKRERRMPSMTDEDNLKWELRSYVHFDLHTQIILCILSQSHACP